MGCFYTCILPPVSPLEETEPLRIIASGYIPEKIAEIVLSPRFALFYTYLGSTPFWLPQEEIFLLKLAQTD